ncbi:MAG: hypothetical protein B7Y99_12265 [Caulobacterales bacterium 32-69-10]|nr:MAG: hypothetical protein B7Y99_12265 [Caulobacterales bacterium 32-69-10]
MQKITYTSPPPQALSQAAEEAVRPKAQPSLAARELVVMSYNVHGLPWPLAERRRGAIRTIGRELAALRAEGKAPDIVLIQENFVDPEELVRAAGYRYWAAGPSRRARPSERLPAGGFARTRYLVSGEGWGKLTGSGLYVLSDYPITDVMVDAYRYCAGFDCLANKGAMMVHIDVPGLPEGLDVVNTHMNARKAAKVPKSRSLRAHHLQTEALNRFIARARTPDAPLLVGGDFNVKNDPDRYYYKAEVRPFTVVSEFCKDELNDCRSGPAIDQPRPWLASQDLQAFAAAGPVSIRPVEARTLFDGTSYARLSDHDGYVVRYRLGWRTAGN